MIPHISKRLSDVIPGSSEKYYRIIGKLGDDRPDVIRALNGSLEYLYELFQDSDNRVLLEACLDAALNLKVDDQPGGLIWAVQTGYLPALVQAMSRAFPLKGINGNPDIRVMQLDSLFWYTSTRRPYMGVPDDLEERVEAVDIRLGANAEGAMSRVGLHDLERHFVMEKYYDVIQYAMDLGLEDIQNVVILGVQREVIKPAFYLKAILALRQYLPDYDPSVRINVLGVDGNRHDAQTFRERLWDITVPDFFSEKQFSQLDFSYAAHTFEYCAGTGFWDAERFDSRKTLYLLGGNTIGNGGGNPYYFIEIMPSGFWVLESHHGPESPNSKGARAYGYEREMMLLRRTAQSYCSPETGRVSMPLLRMIHPQADREVLREFAEGLDSSKAVYLQQLLGQDAYIVAPQLDYDIWAPPPEFGPSIFDLSKYGDVFREQNLSIGTISSLKSPMRVFQRLLHSSGLRSEAIPYEADNTGFGSNFHDSAVSIWVVDATEKLPQFFGSPLLDIMNY
jgi:hypothetical protein